MIYIKINFIKEDVILPFIMDSFNMHVGDTVTVGKFNGEIRAINHTLIKDERFGHLKDEITIKVY